ncbi:hypothetical protein BACI71_120295 [Bacillus mycoides]|uniref:Uncharacterized protein n=1 Tax=Bacillus mycoides TaxID=1405 RepID=A0A653T4Z5_BACMY|nr:hypothetical protein BACI71_120295 [Bacillus mycoides]
MFESASIGERYTYNEKSIKFSFLHLDCQTEGECYDQAITSMYNFIFNYYYVRIIEYKSNYRHSSKRLSKYSNYLSYNKNCVLNI